MTKKWKIEKKLKSIGKQSGEIVKSVLSRPTDKQTDGRTDMATAYPATAIASRGGLKMQDVKTGNQKDEIPENAGPQKHDRKLEDKLPKATTQCN